MGTFSNIYSADDTTGGTIAVASSSSRPEIMIFNYGPDSVHVNFNESADDTCFKLLINTGITFTGQKAKSNLYLACASSGETAEVGLISFPI